MLELDTDVEEYHFADRHIAAQAWAIAAELVARHPDLRISHVVNEDGAPLLIVHDEPQLLHIQFDLVAWILFINVDGEQATLYWDRVFAYDAPATVVDLLEDYTAIGRGTPDLDAPRALTYAVIAAAVRAGVDREVGYQARPVVFSLQDPNLADSDVIDQFPTGGLLAHKVAARFETLNEEAGDLLWLYHEPIWALWAATTPLALLDSDTAEAHTRLGPLSLPDWHAAHETISAVATRLIDLAETEPEATDA